MPVVRWVAGCRFQYRTPTFFARGRDAAGKMRVIFCVSVLITKTSTRMNAKPWRNQAPNVQAWHEILSATQGLSRDPR
jgi:hypothetical protein